MAKSNTQAGWPAVADCFRALCVGIDSPRSLKAALLLKYKEYEQLVSMKILPVEYCDAHRFAGDYAIVSFLKKNASIPYDADTEGAAIAAFARSEEACRLTNARVEAYLSGDLKIDRDVNEVIHLASRKISRLLQVPPSLDDSPYSWGPGATLCLKRKAAYPDTKAVKLPFTVTGSAWKHAARLINSDLHWKEAIVASNPNYTGPIFKVVPGGRYDTAPKNVLTDRSILIEPRLNAILQKSVGDKLRALLKRVEVDLDDQSRNQTLAGLARRLGLATLDLEAASDTVSRKVVELLLPPAWYDLLDDLRSKWVTDKNGKSLKLEKFSSMGNGFTFELESLLFWALATAANELNYRGIVGVYGDDIIVHRDSVPLLEKTFTFLGFKLNREKSFVEGEFFESCGKHYFGETDVTPAYQKCSPTKMDEAARMGNRLLRLANRLGSHGILDKRIRPAWENWFRRWGPTDIQCGPFIGEGDGYWETPKSHYTNRTRYGPFGSWCQVACYSAFVPEIPANDDAMYALWLMQCVPNKHTEWFLMHKIGPCSHMQAIRRFQDLPEPLVTITGTSRHPRKKSSKTAEIGMLPSRVKTSVRIATRSVHLGPDSTALTW